MKKITLTLVLTMAITLVMSQPTAFKYQTVVRDAGGGIISNQNVSFRISIVQDSVNGTAIYTEDHNTTTNGFGLANMAIGNGTLVLGTFDAIDWNLGDNFLEISCDLAGGSNFVLMGTSQLLSVPYAFISGRANALTLTDANGKKYDITVDGQGNLTAFTCGTSIVSDFEGNVYNTILIGNQCWMKENLRTTKYKDGTPIPNVTSSETWSNLTSDAYVWYDNDINWKYKYGALYNGYSATKQNGLCPAGWHVPSINEWKELRDFIGGVELPHGNKLRSCRQVDSPLGGDCNTSIHPRWEYYSTTSYGTDDYGFSATAGGTRNNYGSFSGIGYHGVWFTSAVGFYEIQVQILTYSGSMFFNLNAKQQGSSVRCLKDAVPSAAFISWPNSGIAPLTVYFLDESTQIPTNWQWDFGDGGTSTLQDPVYIYQNAGCYTVQLTVSNSYGSDSEIKTAHIHAGGLPVAAFTGEPTVGAAPLTVNFTDQSENNPTSWQWSFGDGGTGTQQNPLHTYQNIGSYTVQLTVTNSYGSDQEIKTNYINVTSGIPCPGMPTVTDIDGNVYNTVLIGDQCWMKENLKTTLYNDGTPIPNVTNSATWSNLTSGAYVWYNNDINWKPKYGALYNWYAGVDAKGLCPTGWHVPTHNEWTMLTDHIGGSGSANGNTLKSCRQVASPLGGDCSTSEHPRWDQHNYQYGTDDFGFSGLPGGCRYDGGSFIEIGSMGLWWSSVESTSNSAWVRYLSYENPFVWVYDFYKQNGLSVRCIRD
jgi:uncharacterized protein (TIGR02145 family)